jgi:hypothetical protein
MSATRYAAAEKEVETEQRSPTARERLDAQNAVQWTAWSAGVNEKLAALDDLASMLLGGEDKERDPGLLLALAKQAADGSSAEIADTGKTISDALSARVEAEVAVLRDEFVERLDALLLQHSPKKLRAMEAALRKDMNERTSDLDARLDKLLGVGRRH